METPIPALIAKGRTGTDLAIKILRSQPLGYSECKATANYIIENYKGDELVQYICDILRVLSNIASDPNYYSRSTGSYYQSKQSPAEVHIRITCEGGCSKYSTAPHVENQ